VFIALPIAPPNPQAAGRGALASGSARAVRVLAAVTFLTMVPAFLTMVPPYVRHNSAAAVVSRHKT
jgi:hypothetical protein